MAKNNLPVSPLAPKNLPELPEIEGVKLYSGNSGIRYKGRDDLLFAEFAKGTIAAGVFTKSLTRAAPVDWCKTALKSTTARGLVVNAGNANAFTGKAGIMAAKKTAEAAAKIIGCKPQEVFVSSTGVIGVPLPYEKITSKLGKLTNANFEAAAKAITTTDTFIKLSTRKCGSATINGIAKGSGMIAPDMATLLVYVFTDAAISKTKLQKIVSSANERTFNSITVDSDTSTNDTLLVFATGKKKVVETEFAKKLEEVLLELSQLVVKDGEGAQKFIEVKVTGAKSAAAAKKIALSIGNSPLVKTAIAGEDANWGRIVAAIGKSGEAANRDKLKVKIGGVLVAANGAIHPKYREEQIVPHMKGQNILLEADVGVDKGSATIYTCDLTHGYISINADYRS